MSYSWSCFICFFFFFFNDTATTEIYTLSLHDALPIYRCVWKDFQPQRPGPTTTRGKSARSEEHTSELQSQSNLVCRLLLEKKKKLIEDRQHLATEHPLVLVFKRTETVSRLTAVLSPYR